jgi:histidinol-phosphate aminotransferase
MAHKFRFTDLAASLPSTVPFVGPETLERQRGEPFSARIGANENVFGPSPKAIRAMEQAASDVWKYGDPENYALKQALSEHYNIPAEAITVGEGVDALLGNLVRLFVGIGDAVLTSLGAYPTFNYHVTGFGGDLHTVPYRDDYEDTEALMSLAKILRPKLIYLANPDNPMGTVHPAPVVQTAIDAVPDGSLLVLDEAYIECAPDSTAPEIDVTDPRVIRMRTFSKAYGMAGVRVGYAIGHPDVIQAFDRVRNHFGVSRIAQAGALAALADQTYLAENVDRITAARDRIADIAQKNGLRTLASATNFVAVDCGGDGTKSKAVLARLAEAGLFVRMPFVAPQDRCIRISAGRPADLDLLDAALPAALEL